MVLLALCCELYFLDVQDPKVEQVFGVLNKLMSCPSFKSAFFVDFLVAAASENAAGMEKACLLGRLFGLSLLVKDDFSDAGRVEAKIGQKIKACKTKSGYQKTLQVVFK